MEKEKYVYYTIKKNEGSWVHYTIRIVHYTVLHYAVGALHQQITPGTRITTCLGLPNSKRFLGCGAFNAEN